MEWSEQSEWISGRGEQGRLTDCSGWDYQKNYLPALLIFQARTVQTFAAAVGLLLGLAKILVDVRVVREGGGDVDQEWEALQDCCRQSLAVEAEQLRLQWNRFLSPVFITFFTSLNALKSQVDAEINRELMAPRFAHFDPLALSFPAQASQAQADGPAGAAAQPSAALAPVPDGEAAAAGENAEGQRAVSESDEQTPSPESEAVPMEIVGANDDLDLLFAAADQLAQ